ADELLDLLPGVAGADLEPEARLPLRDERWDRHRHVDAVMEEVCADRVDLLGVGERNLDDRIAGDVRRRDAQLTQARQDAIRHPVHGQTQLVAALRVQPQALDHGGERGDRRLARRETWLRGGLQYLLERRRAV